MASTLQFIQEYIDYLRTRSYDVSDNPSPFTTVSGNPMHNYFPPDAPIPNLISNTQTASQIILTFGALVAALLTITTLLFRRLNPGLSLGELCTVAWFTLCGFLHTAFEAYYVLHRDTFASSNTLFAQLWKEYALSDSRYITGDVALWTLEGVTAAVLGPLSLLAAYFAATRSPHRLVLRTIVSVGHVYSATLYFALATADELLRGTRHSRPEPLYFWGYYVGLNAVWIVVPALLIYSTATEIASTMRAIDALEARLGRSRELLQQELKHLQGTDVRLRTRPAKRMADKAVTENGDVAEVLLGANGTHGEQRQQD